MGHCGLRAGHIRFAGRQVSGLPPHRRVSLGIGLVPQEREIFPSLTVEENLLVAARSGEWSVGRVYDLFPSLAARRKHRGKFIINWSGNCRWRVEDGMNKDHFFGMTPAATLYQPTFRSAPRS